MKHKIIVTVLSVMCAVLCVFGLMACGGNTENPASSHTHRYAKNVADKYKVSDADCTHKAVYYKSCSVCGEKGTETFEYGEEPEGHDFGGGVTCIKCSYHKPSEGVNYVVSYWGPNDVAYVNGIGTCSDTEIYIADIYNGYPVTSIGGGAFMDCSSLTSITIPNGVTSIERSAFNGCTGLTSITIPNSVTSIEYEAFRGCGGLTSITIPNSVTIIGEGAFSYCGGLTSITIPNSVTIIGEGAFSYCGGLISVNIGNGVTSILCYTFYNCSGLTSITIPNSVTSIGDFAFKDCSDLTNITIGNSVTSIGEAAFSYCSSLTSITIPNGVTSIKYEAFRGCSGLTSITIPNSVTRIGGYVFRDCGKLDKVYYRGSSEDWKNITVDFYNSFLTDVTRYYYSETEPTALGNYWHYADDGVTVVEW